jgi:hypothetical protein
MPNDSQNLDALHGEPSPPSEGPLVTVQISFKGKTSPVTVPPSASVLDLKQTLESTLQIPPTHQKLVSKGRQLADSEPVSPLNSQKIMLLATQPSAVASINAQKPQQRRRSPYAVKLPQPRSTASSSAPDINYTFHRLVPLAHLPQAEKARELLDRLVHDRGIIAIMKKYKWSVGALVEMDPAEHTYVDHKTLGLNRNRGEVIELRIRTDDYGGFRQYRCMSPYPPPFCVFVSGANGSNSECFVS